MEEILPFRNFSMASRLSTPSPELNLDLFGFEDNCTGINGSLFFFNNTLPEEPINRFSIYWWQVIFLWALLSVIVIGNSAVLAALVLAKTPRKTRMNFFIMHLALADLLVGLINVMSDLVFWRMPVAWYLGNAACKLIKYFQTVVLYSSNYVLVALSIDRFDAIRYPLKFSQQWRRARVLIAMAWFLSFLFASPALFVFHEQDVTNPRTCEKVLQCWVDMAPADRSQGVAWQWKLYLTIVFFVLFMIPAIIIAVCYTVMVHTIWTPSRILTPKSTPQNKKGSSNGILRKTTSGNKTEADEPRPVSSRGLIPKAKIKSVKMTFAIVFVFILCSSPYLVFSLLQVYDCLPETQTTTALSTFFSSLSPLNSAANPIIYCLFSTHICRNLRKVKVINWMAVKFCPKLGRASPANRRKFGPAHHQDISQKTRTECTSLSDSLTRSANSIQSSRYPSAGAKRQIDSTCFVNKEVHFQPDHRSAEMTLNNRVS